MADYDVIVIGGGPAGLFAAALCGASGLSVCLLERNRSAGKKLLISGQGRCNLTNSLPLSEFILRYGGKTRFVRKSLYAFTNKHLMEMLTSGGLRLLVREDGKVFPETENANDVLKHFLTMCRKSDVDIEYDSLVTGIGLEPGGFSVSAGDVSRTASAVILAAGGFTFPSTGSDGNAYSIAESLGHSIVPPRPSLAGIIAEPEDCRHLADCAGISLEAVMRLCRKGAGIKSCSGRLLFTHKGLSGPLIIDNSRDFMEGDLIELNLLRGHDYDSASAAFIDFTGKNGKSAVKRFFREQELPDRLISAVFSASGSSLSPSSRSAEIPAAERKKLIRGFTSLAVSIRSVEGKNRAMCTAGGIETSGINPATMESRIVPGLYFAGEIIDVDGDSGGFNLQFAFSSAAAAAASIIKSSK